VDRSTLDDAVREGAVTRSTMVTLPTIASHSSAVGFLSPVAFTAEVVSPSYTPMVDLSSSISLRVMRWDTVTRGSGSSALSAIRSPSTFCASLLPSVLSPALDSSSGAASIDATNKRQMHTA